MKLQAQEITKKFGEQTALDHVDLTIESGEFFGLLGTNGAGKTTMIRILSTLGIMVSAIRYLTGWDIPIATAPLEDALATVCAIAIVLLGCLPMAELLKRALSGFVNWIGTLGFMPSMVFIAFARVFSIAITSPTLSVNLSAVISTFTSKVSLFLTRSTMI